MRICWIRQPLYVGQVRSLNLCMNFAIVETAGATEAHPQRVNIMRAYRDSEARMYGVAKLPEQGRVGCLALPPKISDTLSKISASTVSPK